MIKHIILWKFKDEFTEEQIKTIKTDAKTALEGLKDVIDGIIEMKVITEGLDSSTCDMMLYSEFKSQDALKAYKVNPAHQAVANTFVRPNVQVRLCMDYEE